MRPSCVLRCRRAVRQQANPADLTRAPPRHLRPVGNHPICQPGRTFCAEYAIFSLRVTFLKRPAGEFSNKHWDAAQLARRIARPRRGAFIHARSNSRQIWGPGACGTPPELQDEILAVSPGGKLIQRHSDDRRVRKHQTPALGESGPRVGRDWPSDARRAQIAARTRE